MAIGFCFWLLFSSSTLNIIPLPFRLSLLLLREELQFNFCFFECKLSSLACFLWFCSFSMMYLRVDFLLVILYGIYCCVWNRIGPFSSVLENTHEYFFKCCICPISPFLLLQVVLYLCETFSLQLSCCLIGVSYFPAFCLCTNSTLLILSLANVL